MVGGMLSVSALSASLLNQVEPTQCLIRGAIAYIVGSSVAQMWNIFFTQTAPDTPVLKVEESTTSASSESEELDAAS